MVLALWFALQISVAWDFVMVGLLRVKLVFALVNRFYGVFTIWL